jgi:hypothetical protein
MAISPRSSKVVLKKEDLEEYLGQGFDADEVATLTKAINIIADGNYIALVKLLESINASEEHNLQIAKAAHKFVGAYEDSRKPDSFKSDLNSIPLKRKLRTAQAVAEAANLKDARIVGKIIRELHIKKKEGYFSNDDVAKIKEVYTNKEYGSTIDERIKTRKKIDGLSLEYISPHDLLIRTNKKLSKANKNTGVFDLD